MVPESDMAERKRPRGRPRCFDRDTALEAAMMLFWDRGYEATSMDDLAEVMGLSPSSVYACFGNKEKLYEAALDRYLEGPGSYVARILAEDIPVRTAFERLFEAAARELTREGRPAGCMVATAATHCSPAASSVRAALAEMRADHVEQFEARIRRGIAAGELPAETDAAALARFLATVLQGLTVQARDGASRAELQAIGRLAMRCWPA
ncbi:TetR family transcriptional regulator [Chelatococcus composti]|jgi:AcrR family transcriptional regulator|nr:TetR family transcriptional regulator [Chelatococcus composti]